MNSDIVRTLLPERIQKNIEYFAGRTWLLPRLMEWFENSDERFFILQGAPGTGKSMIMAWLAGVRPSPPSGDEQSRVTLERINSLVKGVHFCTANTGSISPKNLAENLANQLTKQVEGFSDALAASLSNRVQISATISYSDANSITGNYIKELNLGGLDDDSSFNLSLRDPLKKLYELGYNEPMIILVDALDESLTYTGQKRIVEILAGLSDIPKKVRFIVTTRPDPSVLVHFQNIKPFDLVKDASASIDDIYLYVLERMQQRFASDSINAKIDPLSVEKLATKISDAAKGIFLYAHLLFISIPPKLSDISAFVERGLPEELGGLYNTFLNREIGTNEERWYNDFKPLLGLISVSQGKGLTKNQLNNIIRHDIEHSLSIWDQYLEGLFPDGPFRVFHKSFSDFLTGHEDNVHYQIDVVEMHRKIVYHYWRVVHPKEPERITNVDRWERIARKEKNESYYYPLRHLAEHMDYLVKPVLDAEEQEIDMLYDLARNIDFANAQLEHVGDVELPLKTIKFAITAASQLDDAPSIAEFMIAHARRVLDTRKKESPLLMLRSGQGLERVWNACDLYDIEISSLWHLLIAWELYDTGTRVIDAKNTLKRLSGKGLVRFETEQFRHLIHLMTLLLVIAHNIDEDLFEALYPKLLHPYSISLLKEMLKAKDIGMAEKIHVKKAGSSSFGLLVEPVRQVKAQAQAGHIEEAKKTAEGIEDVSWKSSAFLEIAIAQAIAQAQAGDNAGSRGTVSNGILDLETEKKIDELLLLRALLEIAKAQAQAGDNAGSRDTFEEARKIARQIERIPSFVSAELVKAQAQAGHIEEAKKTAEGIEDVSWKSSAFLEIAKAQAQAGHIEEAKKTADKLNEQGYDASRALKEVAIAQAQAGHIEEAKKTAKEIENEPDKSSAFSEIAIAQAQAGDNAGSRDTFEEAKKTAKEIENEPDKSSAFSEIAKVQAQAKMFQSALETSKQILVNREDHLMPIANEIIDAGGKEEFKQILVSCSSDLVGAIRAATMLFKAYPEQSNDISTSLSHVLKTIL